LAANKSNIETFKSELPAIFTHQHGVKVGEKAFSAAFPGAHFSLFLFWLFGNFMTGTGKREWNGNGKAAAW